MTSPRRPALCLIVLALSAGPLFADDAAEVAADEKLLRDAGQATDGPALIGLFRRCTPTPELTATARGLVKRVLESL